MISSRLLFIEPKNNRADDPIIDELTRKMAASLNNSARGNCYFGTHQCCCGASSEPCDRILSNGQGTTNSLAVHYLALHRNECRQSDLEKVAALQNGETEPTDNMIWAGIPEWKRTKEDRDNSKEVTEKAQRKAKQFLEQKWNEYLSGKRLDG